MDGRVNRFNLISVIKKAVKVNPLRTDICGADGPTGPFVLCVDDLHRIFFYLCGVCAQERLANGATHARWGRRKLYKALPQKEKVLRGGGTGVGGAIITVVRLLPSPPPPPS